MKAIFGRKLLVGLMTISLLGAGLPSVSNAAVIGTQAYFEASQREGSQARVEGFVNRQGVRDQMIALGADPAEVQQRIAALTDAELRALEQRLDTLPAGGSLLGLIGLVFVVLLILELTGTIDIFKKT